MEVGATFVGGNWDKDVLAWMSDEYVLEGYRTRFAGVFNLKYPTMQG